MTKKQLVKVAERKGVTVTSKMTKDEIEEAIASKQRQADKGTPVPGEH